MSEVESVYFNIEALPVGASAGIVGLDNTERLKPYLFEGCVAKKITDTNKPYARIQKGSITAGEQLALFNAYLLAELGEYQLTEEQKDLLSYLFEEPGKGNVCATAVDYTNGDTEVKKPQDYCSVLWITEPDNIVYKNGVWIAEGGNKELELLPPSGYVGRTNDGSYNQKGVPFETWGTREEAEQTWITAGFPEDFAEKAVSYFTRSEEGKGIGLVLRWYSLGRYGRFSLNASMNPSSSDLVDGRLFVCRSLNRANLNEE